MINSIGEVKNQGIELLKTSHNISKTDFKWLKTITFSYTKNEIIDLYGDGTDIITGTY